MAKVSPIPEDRPQLSTYLTVSDGAKAIEFYKKAFGAEEVTRLSGADGRIGHAELKIGNAWIMLADEFHEYGNKSPTSLGGSPVMVHLYVEDADAVAKQAVQAGAQLVQPVEDQFYGDRGGKLTDPFGHSWWVASHVEDVPPEEMRRRAQEMYGMT